MRDNIYPKTTRQTIVSTVHCDCGWVGESQRNVLSEVQTHVLRTHLEDAIEAYPRCNPFDAAYYYATDVARIIITKHFVLDDAVLDEIHDLEEAHASRLMALNKLALEDDADGVDEE